METEILAIAKTYFEETGEQVSDGFLLSLISTVVEGYMSARNYPESYTDEMINLDTVRYLSLHKHKIATRILPEMYGRVGAEGQQGMTENGITRSWIAENYFSDVRPICGVV